jgi:hypothetical protein
MEQTFYSIPGPHDTALFADIPTVDSLLKQVDQLQEAVDYDALERLEEENEMLEQSVKRGRQRLLSVANVLREAYEAYVVLNAYLQDFEQDAEAIDAEWAAFLPIGAIQNAGPEDRIRALISN